MRTLSVWSVAVFGLLFGLFGACGGKKDDPKTKPGDPTPKVVDPTPVMKKPIDTRPMPLLAVDPGGATGKPLWGVAFGGLGSDTPRAVAVSASGDTYVVGYFDGEIDFGPAGKFVSSSGEKKKTDAYLVKIGADGKIAWAKTWGGKRDDVATAVAIRGDNIVVVGQFLDEIKIGEFTKKSSGSDDIFVAAFDKDGGSDWLWGMGGIDSDGANAIAATSDGGWIIGGSYNDTFDIASFKLKAKGIKGRTEALLVKLKASGDPEWVKTFGGRDDDTIAHVAIDNQNSIIVQGHFKDESDWGGKPLKAGGGSDNDIVLAKYDANGDHVWSQGFGNAFNDVAGGVAVDPSGHVTMVGSFDKTVSFGTGDTHTASGESDAYVARFAPDGKLVWAKTYGGDRPDQAFGVAVDKAGNSVAAGLFANKVDFGKGEVTSNTPNKDVFIIKHDAKGAVVWVKTFGDKDHDHGRAVAMDGDGNPTIAGIFHFKLDLVTPALESVRKDDDPIPMVDTYVLHLER